MTLPRDGIPEDPRGPGDIRLIVCDLDGTLLNSRKLISPENLGAIREAQERGIFVTICSGRGHAMLEAYSRALNIRGPLIAVNGAVLFDTRTGEMPYRRCVDPERALSLLGYCKSRGLDHLILTSGGCWYAEGSGRIRRFEEYNRIAAEDKLSPIPLRRFGSDYREVVAEDIYKILISGMKEEEQSLIEDHVQSLGNLYCTSSDRDLLDVSAQGVNKGTGVRKLAEILGLDKGRICVFGDYRNDIPMLQEAGLPIAMGNAEDRVKKYALAVTASNDEDGVALGIKRYILQNTAEPVSKFDILKPHQL
jgi:Cof subfamily protein (haloacid dehalogenase superfamily)